MEEYKILHTAANQALSYLESLPDRRAFPSEESLKELEKFSFALPDSATDPEVVM